MVVISFCISTFHLCSTVLRDANVRNFSVLVYNCSKKVYGNQSFPHRVQKDKNESIIFLSASS